MRGKASGPKGGPELHGDGGNGPTKERRETLVADGGFVEIGDAIDEVRFRPVVNGVGRAATLVVRVLPKRGGAVDAVFVERVKKDVEGGELLFVVVVVACDAGHSFEAGIGGRHALAHHFDDGVAAGDLDVFFAFAGGAGGADFVIDAAAGADDGRIANAAGNFSGQAGGGGSGGDVALFVDGHAGNLAGGRIGDDPLRLVHKGLVCGRVTKDRGHFFFPFGAVDAGTPVEGSGRFPGQPDFAGVFGEEIHFLETFVHREAACAVANDHDVIGALHHGLREA